ncbi:hypothetical protein AB4455_16370 [Vibrio sp. 10N.261.46.E12]|uniref:hypothetical protein n=1 Tax=unclassified Vibrio TaxID=2614977 RepID=UPI000977ADCF|nr:MULTISPECIES: hypothetical protein [unclassified Vibrio]OMO34245.1 hypothetical protein BH584_13210 [Vibrio sp. 10N.261.45.E1]PMJ28168.1 hypothetical protein BCU27_05540 [Vibrio sp. 10N.286.45.B6]PML89103.1 hypothetical protein BCT66_08865 [Vibrio sp. 10N.261.49.E11]PMM70992.1 hypothetical protein BCT48_08530 [Vibrio sp. 10N.261.46.F12]PMM90069.1 hypothetical protein BCT46_04035 [Vibrio sp. 10N.261.46.E8]
MRTRYRYLILFLLFPMLALAECKGKWSVDIDKNNIQFNQDLSANIPVYIQLSKGLQQCNPRLAFVTLDNKKEGVLKSRASNLETQLLDKNFRHLRYTPQFGFGLPLENSPVTRMWIKVPKAKLANAGHYSAQLDTKLVLDNDTKRLRKTVKLNIPAFVSLTASTGSSSLRGMGSNAYTLALGVIESHKKYRAELSLVSNSNVKVKVKQKYGALTNKSSKELRIPYTFRINNVMASNNSTFSFSNKDGVKYWGIPFEVKIGNADFANAGKYQDTITVEVKAMP